MADEGVINQLSIEDVDKYINRGTEFSDQELGIIENTQEIDLVSASNTLINFATNIGGIREYIIENDTVIEELLAASNSDLLSNGEVAKEKKQYLTDNEMELTNIFNAGKEMLDHIENIVTNYNNKLKKIKTAVKFQLLHHLADKINEEAENKRPTYLYNSTTSVEPENIFSDKIHIIESELMCIWYEVKELAPKIDANGEEIPQFKVTKYEAAYCNYWANSRIGRHNKAWYNPFTWGDDNVAELEGKIQTIASRISEIKMPY